MHLLLNAEGSGRLLMIASDLRKRFVSNPSRNLMNHPEMDDLESTCRVMTAVTDKANP